jgi:Flp pilus assembly protein CpaB
VKRSNRILILVGVFIAAMAFIGVLLLSGSSTGPGPAATPTPTQEAKTTVVVAARDINVGETITDAMVTLKTVTVSQAAAYGTDTFSSKDQVRDKVAAGFIRSGDPLHDGIDFLHIVGGSVTQGQDIASLVDPGYVAVAMEIDQTNGVGTLIVPGDHVDIILAVWVDQIALAKTNTNETQISVPGGQQVTSKMLFQNCKVLATLLPAVAEAATEAPVAGASVTPVPSPTVGSVTNNGQHMLVILEVKPDQAEVIRWAQRAEKQDPQTYIDLSLALRSPKDNDTPDVTTLGVTFSELVTRYGVLPPDPRGIIPAHLADGIKW